MRFLEILEPEAVIGNTWERLVRNIGNEPHHANSKITFDEIKSSAGVIFRALSGNSSVEILGNAQDIATNRLSYRTKFIRGSERVIHAQYDGQKLHLPASIDIFEDNELTRNLYLWLAALAAFIDIPRDLPSAPFLRDRLQIRLYLCAERRLLKQCPGFLESRKRLGTALIALRPQTSLPYVEDEVEKALREIISSPGLDISDIKSTNILEDQLELTTSATSNYKPFRPVVLWPIIQGSRNSDASQLNTDEIPSSSSNSQESNHFLRANRQDADQADRKDSFILHRFESIFSMIDFLNINRKTEDDDANIKKSANDLEDVSFVKSSKSPKIKIKFHVDLAPQDVDNSKLIGKTLYPEWNWKTRAYLKDYVHVEERLGQEATLTPLDQISVQRQIQAVKRQFEVLRPRRIFLKSQPDGQDLDIDEVIRNRCDFLASGETNDRFYCVSHNNERDLAVSVLFDASRSTEAFVDESSIIDIGKQALVALAEGITACGDDISIHAFSSLKRERVMITLIKQFEEKLSHTVHQRIMGLTPSYYTRMGAAIRHVSSYLTTRGNSRRLLLLITDGLPNDLDHYEGRYGIEDTRRSVMEARQQGHIVFGITIDAKAQQYLPHIFGPSGFCIIPDINHLIRSLPKIYSQLVG